MQYRAKRLGRFKAALQEVEEALKTGWFVGIGEFAPGSSARNLQVPGAEGPVSFEQRVDEWAALCELASSTTCLFSVTISSSERRELDPDPATGKVSEMNPKAKIVQTHGCVEDEWERGLDAIKDMYTVVRELDNVYMETGGWCEKQFEVAFEVGVTATI